MRFCRAVVGALVFAVVSLGCGDSDDRTPRGEGGSGGAPGEGGAGGFGGEGAAGGMGGAGGVTEEPDMKLLTPNLVGYVSPAAAAEARAFLSVTSTSWGVALTTHRFFELFPDEFDFIYVLVASDEGAAGVHGSLNRPAIPGTGIRERTSDPSHGSSRLRGVVTMRQSGGPPLHETMHYWGAHLRDPSLGFGIGRDTSHWGYAGVNGVLGGFDASTLRCLTPVDAEPPCTPNDDGTTTFVVRNFAPNHNATDFGELELYLMGLVDAAEVAPIPVFHGVHDQVHVGGGIAHVTADSLQTVTIEDIIAIYGERAPAAAADRAFRGAYILVTDEAPTAAEISAADAWARSFGCQNPEQPVHCFADAARGLATMDTRIER